MSTTDPLLDALAGLAAEPAGDLLERIVARWVRVEAPAGPMYVVSTDHGVSYLRTAAAVDDDPEVLAESYCARFGRPVLPARRPPPGLLPALRTGRTGTLALDLRGLSDLERDVLLAARSIPRGEVRPYGWVAARIGRPRAWRAVGSALARNPVPLLIPCHRVTLSDGGTGQYVFGPDLKDELLRSEHANLDEVRDLARAKVHYLASDTTGVVCFPTCANVRRITPAHRHGFRTLTQARAAGYRPCKRCQPAAATG